MFVSAGMGGRPFDDSTRQFPRDVLGIARDLLQIGNQLSGAPGRKTVPDASGLLVVAGKDFAQEPVAGGGQHNTIGSAIGSDFPACHQPPLFQAVHQAGQIRAVHDELAAEVGLGEALGIEVQQVEDIELARAEVPPLEEDPAGVPERVRRAQQLHQGLVARMALIHSRSHIDCLQYHCRYVNIILPCPSAARSSQFAKLLVNGLPREAFGLRPACWRFPTVVTARKREQAPCTPNASRSQTSWHALMSWPTSWREPDRK